MTPARIIERTKNGTGLVFRIKPPKLQRSHVESFSLIEVNRIIQSAREDNRHYYAMRFYSGIRTGGIDRLS
jgi:integrase